MKRRRSLVEVWRGPILVGGASVVGLLAALSGGTAGAVISWIALAVPVAVCVRALWPD